MIRNAVFIGIIISIIYTVIKIIILFSDLSKTINLSPVPTVIQLFLIGILMYAGMYFIRKNNYENSINFGQAFYSSIAISLSTAVSMFIIWAIFDISGIIINQHIITDINLHQQLLDLKIITEPPISAVQKVLSSPYHYAKMYSLTLLIWTPLVGTIVALFVRNKDTFTSHLTEDETK